MALSRAADDKEIEEQAKDELILLERYLCLFPIVVANDLYWPENLTSRTENSVNYDLKRTFVSLRNRKHCVWKAYHAPVDQGLRLIVT